MLKLSSDAVYCVQRCSTSSRTPISFVGQHFQPPQHRMQERALPFEHARHEGAQRLRADQDQAEEQRDLENSNASHNFLSEPLRTKQARKSDTRTARATRFQQ